MQALFVFAAFALFVAAVVSGIKFLDALTVYQSVAWCVAFVLCAVGVGVMCSAFGVAFVLGL